MAVLWITMSDPVSMLVEELPLLSLRPSEEPEALPESESGSGGALSDDASWSRPPLLTVCGPAEAFKILGIHDLLRPVQYRTKTHWLYSSRAVSVCSLSELGRRGWGPDFA